MTEFRERKTQLFLLFLLLILYTIFLCMGQNVEDGDGVYEAVETHGFEIHVANSSSSLINNKYLLEIDLGSCTCKNTSDSSPEVCEIGIKWSTVLEINCDATQLYCCSGRQRHKKDGETEEANEEEINQEFRSSSLSLPLKESIRSGLDPSDIEIEEDPSHYEEEEESPVDNPRFRLVPVTSYKGNDEEDEDEEDYANLMVPSTTNKKKICSCKPFGECDPSHLDLRYGYASICTHNQSRCCEPQQADDKIIIKGPPSYEEIDEGDNYHGKTNDKGEGTKCRCLPEAECQPNNGKVVDYESPSCPTVTTSLSLMRSGNGRIVQCCGSDLNEDSLDVDQRRFDGDIPYLPEGYPLPVQKIPSSESADEMTTVKSTMPPPQLPNYYYHRDNGVNKDNNNKAVLPSSSFIPSQGSNSYYYNPNPSQSQVRPKLPFTPHHHHRYPYGEEEGRGFGNYNNNPQGSSSILDKIKDILG